MGVHTQKITGFDNEKYLQEQTKAILGRVDKFCDKLYLEFGGKLTFDYHAARVLPGYDPNVKIRLLQRLKDKIEIVFCVSAKDIAKGRIRGDFNITYDIATLRALDDLRDYNLPIAAVSINRFSGESSALQLKSKVERMGIRVHTQADIEGYPVYVDRIVSEEGYGKNPYIETTKPIVVITGAGPGSGKMATGLSQLYHDHRAGRSSGFAKFETFPIWGLPVSHPVNIAYEAATADLADFNLVDPFHLAAYNETAVNYNRDVENFPILHRIIEMIVGSGSELPNYRSPTDMGVNCAAAGIVDDGVVRESARQEIIRRYFRYRWEYRIGIERKETVDRAKALVERIDAKPEDRKPVVPAREAALEAEREGKGNKGVFCGAAIELNSGEVVSGKNSPLMHSGSAAVLNAVKSLAGIPDKIDLLPRVVIENLTLLKRDVLGMSAESLDVSEIQIALAISATTNPSAQAGLDAMRKLRGCEMHMTHIPSQGDQVGLRRTGVNLTTDAEFTPGGYFLR
ncbi:MAG TPA: DUF1846 domain-containing protein [Myxococcota bacterium]|nr:DUF1846 domain-containing protein [Myxococcota bacterium]